MTDPNPPSPKMKIVIGVAAAGAGVYFLLVGAGLLPIPRGPGNLHAPLWVVLCAGLAFFLSGVAIILQVPGRANDHGEFPADAPEWLKRLQYLIGVMIFASFGAIGSWIAFGPGERVFSGSVGLFSAEVSTGIGRIVFGVSAIVVWLCTFAFAVSGASRLWRRNKREQQ